MTTLACLHCGELVVEQVVTFFRGGKRIRLALVEDADRPVRHYCDYLFGQRIAECLDDMGQLTECDECGATVTRTRAPPLLCDIDGEPHDCHRRQATPTTTPSRQRPKTEALRRIEP